MKFSHKWLNEYLADIQSSQDLADTLTLAGLEVDAIEPVVKEKVSNVVVGQIKVINKHPDADKLNVCTVDVAETELLTIVCGASNIYEGMKAPVAKIGAVLPGDFKIKKSKLRGQESFGMMCSEEELGLLEKADGLMDLPADAPIGTDINEYLGLNDNTLEVDLTPNRADCLSVYGIAREVAALRNIKLKPLHIQNPVVEIEDTKEVFIKAKDACKAYYGCIIRDVDNSVETPLWMVEKLRRSGIGSISFLVDVTNYVLLLTGQPMHAFDLDKLEGGINIRYAEDKEKLTLLDETKVELESDTLVIADEKKALAMAGVMGGLDSAISDSTKNIFLESAFFVPEKIAGKARKYNLHTDSSHRFERGVDPQLAQQAMKLAIQLIVEIAGGKVAPIYGSEDADFLNSKRTIKLSVIKLNKVLGTQFDFDYIANVLKSLHMTVNKIDDTTLEVIAPSYRFDMEIQEDLIEEIARFYGYSKLPETMPQYKAQKVNISEEKESLQSLKSKLVDRGYYETINYSFIDPKHDEYFFDERGIALQNPISQDLSVMRQSLIPGLLNTFKANINRQQNRVRIFEEGVCFFKNAEQRIESPKFAGLVFGDINPTTWISNRVVDFFDVKNDIEALCSHIKNLSFKICDDIHWLHPGQSAYIYSGNERIGIVGVLHPTALKALQIKSKAPIVFELDLIKLTRKEIVKFEKFSKFPSVSRDISFLVANDSNISDILEPIKSLNIFSLKGIDISSMFAVSQGFNVSVRFLFSDLNKTLEDEAINKFMNKIINCLDNNSQVTVNDEVKNAYR